MSSTPTVAARVKAFLSSGVATARAGTRLWLYSAIVAGVGGGAAYAIASPSPRKVYAETTPTSRAECTPAEKEAKERAEKYAERQKLRADAVRTLRWYYSNDRICEKTCMASAFAETNTWYRESHYVSCVERCKMMRVVESTDRFARYCPPEEHRCGAGDHHVCVKCDGLVDVHRAYAGGVIGG